MRRKQRQIIAIFTLFIMLLPLITGCALHISNVPAKTTEGVAEENTTEAPEPTTEEGEVTIEGSTTEEPTTEPPTEETPTTEEPTIEEPTTETPEPVSIELTEEQAKREVLVLGIGAGEGQVGYKEWTDLRGTNRSGPNGFAVMDEKIYVWDSVNKRIICFADGKFSEIAIGKKDVSFRQMLFADEEIYLVTASWPSQIYVYGWDGTEKCSISLPRSISMIDAIVKRSDTSIEIDCLYGVDTANIEKAIVRCDWVTGECTKIGESPSSLWTSLISESVRKEHPQAEAIAKVEEDIFYQIMYQEEGYYPFSGLRYVVNRQAADGLRWYVSLDVDLWFHQSFQLHYVDENGRFYVMECFEDRTVISELLLGE